MRPAPPTPEELAAIVAAVEVAWPAPAPAVPAERRSPGWRFSGRWWAAGAGRGGAGRGRRPLR